jgi:hypothetical protein
MPYSKWQRTIDKYSARKPRTMKQILSILYRRYGSHQRVADFLGMTKKGLREWVELAGCDTREITILFCKERIA